MFVSHIPYLTLPFHWDEVGQFVPAARDLYLSGKLVPASATPNVHPPGLMAYLALVWKLTGFSIAATRVAMLLAASIALWLTFLLAIELCREVPGAPAFTAAILLMVSPLFYTQAMMAQLDMPAMLFTVLALLLFLQNRTRAAALATVALVLVKETGIVVPAVFAVWLLAEKRRREAVWFALPFAALGAWLAVLYASTGHLFGNTAFTDYNLTFPLHPVRVGIALARRAFSLFIENFHFIGWIAVAVALSRTGVMFRKGDRPAVSISLRDTAATPPRGVGSRAWRIAATLGVVQALAVTVLGGATLERYLLPVLPLMYIAFAAAWSALRAPWTRVSQAALVAGFVACLVWNPPYPYPFENNLAMVDFVRLQQRAAEYLENAFPSEAITTAWPLSIELRRPYLGYVTRKLSTEEVPGYRPADLRQLDPAKLQVLVVFSREWETAWDPRRTPLINPLMRRFYGYEPQMAPDDIEHKLGVRQIAHWTDRGQWVTVYAKGATPDPARLP